MATSTISVPLSDNLKAYVDAKVSSGAFHTTGDYVRELIQEDRSRQRSTLEARLLSSLEEEPIDIPDEIADADQLDLYLAAELEKRGLQR